MNTLPPLITGMGYLIGLLLVAAGLGRRLLQWFHIRIPETAMRGIVAVALGMGALQVPPFILFALGVGWPRIILTATAVLMVLLVPDMRVVVRSSYQWLAQPWKIAGWERFLLIVISLFLLSLFIRSVCPILEIDSLLYHLTVSYRFLDAGRFLHLVTLTPTNWPLGTQMLHSILLSLDPDAPVAIVSFIYGVLTLAAVYFYGIHMRSRLFGAIAGAVLLTHNVLWTETSSALVDLPLTAFATLAAIMLDRSYKEESSSIQWRMASAIFAGFAATVKLQGLWVVLSLLVVILIDRPGLPFRERLRSTLRYGTVALAFAIPWYVRTWVLTGNPVYPMLYNIFGGTEWTTEGWARYAENFIIGEGPLFLPSTPGIAYGSFVVRCILSIVLAYCALRFTRASQWRVLIVYAAMFHVLISFGSALNARLLLPGVPAFGLWLAGIFERWRYRPILMLCVCVCFWTAFVSLEKVHVGLSDATRVATGFLTRQEYLRNNLKEYEIVQYANQHLPPDSRILVSLERINTAMFHFTTFWGTYWEQDSFHYDSLERLRSDLRRMGVTHIVLSTELTPYCDKNPNCRKRMEVEFPAVTRVAEEDGRLLFSGSGISLYSLKSGTARLDASR